MKEIVFNWMRMPEEMALNPLNSPLKSHVPSIRNREKNLFQSGNLLFLYDDRERPPFKHLEEGRHEIIGNNDGNALIGYRFQDSRTVDFEPARAQAEFAALHKLYII